jgi:dTDP-4-dehydrorhamnose 3,5-epimerase
LDEITLTPLKKIYNTKGDIYHAIKKSDDGFNGFGEAYFSTIHKNEVKGWKKHTKMSLNLIVPMGEIKFVIYNKRTKEFFSAILSQGNYQRLTVRPGVWVAFKGLDEKNMLLNIASIEHDPNEAINIELSEIKYEW